MHSCRCTQKSVSSCTLRIFLSALCQSLCQLAQRRYVYFHSYYGILNRVCISSESACSISLCLWKYYLASSSRRLFKPFSQRSPPNSEPCFLSFSSATHYLGHVEKTLFREESKRGGGGWREVGGVLGEGQRGGKMIKNERKPERKRQKDLMRD